MPPLGGGALGARLVVGETARRIDQVAAGLLDGGHATSLGAVVARGRAVCS